jgi:hypothetical protein
MHESHDRGVGNFSPSGGFATAVIHGNSSYSEQHAGGHDQPAQDRLRIANAGTAANNAIARASCKDSARCRQRSLDRRVRSGDRMEPRPRPAGGRRTRLQPVQLHHSICDEADRRQSWRADRHITRLRIHRLAGPRSVHHRRRPGPRCAAGKRIPADDAHVRASLIGSMADYPWHADEPTTRLDHL